MFWTHGLALVYGLRTLGWPEQNAALDKYFPTSTPSRGDILFSLPDDDDATAVVDQIPFDTVYLHGLVHAKGNSVQIHGNVIDPLDIIDEYGADALRFTNATMASTGVY